jgi:hypothetical protein
VIFMIKHLLLASSSLLLSVSAASAQEAPKMAEPVPAAPNVAVVAAPVAENILRAGTEVPLITREELTTKKKKLRVGQRVQMEVAADVVASGVTVIPSGTPATGEITEVRNKGMWGKSGYIGARAISLRMGDRYVRLTGTFDDKGVTGTGGVVAAVAFVPIAGFFTTGTSALIPSGSGVKAFLDEDIAFRTVAVEATAVQVPAAAAAPAAAVPAPAAPATTPGTN